MQTIPLCPITGLPATRRIQPISARLIIDLWRGAFGVATERQLAEIDHFGLWESPFSSRCWPVTKSSTWTFTGAETLVEFWTPLGMRGQNSGALPS